MGDGFENPVVGGTALRIPAIQSPNYDPGVQGWIIKIDGSAEFNDLVVRGTFQGQDFVINSEGIFLYSGTPAAGNLIGSWAPAAGTDTFGNKYEQGLISYDPFGLNDGKYAALTQGTLQLGNLDATVGPDFTDSAQMDSAISTVAGSSFVRLLSPHNDAVGDVVPGILWLVAGQSGAATGSTGAPYAMFSSDTQLSPVDQLISGSIIKDLGFDTRETWHTAVAASGWTIGTLKYRLDAQDNVVWSGYISQNAGATGAGGAVTTAAVAARYRPKANTPAACAWTSSSTVAKGAGTVVFNSNGTLSILWPTTTATNDRFHINETVPLGNLP